MSGSWPVERKVKAGAGGAAGGAGVGAIVAAFGPGRDAQRQVCAPELFQRMDQHLTHDHAGGSHVG